MGSKNVCYIYSFVGVTQNMCGGQRRSRDNLQKLVLFFTLQVPGIELMLFILAASNQNNLSGP